MKVKELIEKLKEYNENYDVVFDEGAYVKDVEEVKIGEWNKANGEVELLVELSYK